MEHFMQLLDTIVDIVFLAAVALTCDLNNPFVVNKTSELSTESFFDGIGDGLTSFKVPLQHNF